MGEEMWVKCDLRHFIFFHDCDCAQTFRQAIVNEGIFRGAATEVSG